MLCEQDLVPDRLRKTMEDETGISSLYLIKTLSSEERKELNELMSSDTNGGIWISESEEYSGVDEWFDVTLSEAANQWAWLREHSERDVSFPRVCKEVFIHSLIRMAYNV